MDIQGQTPYFGIKHARGAKPYDLLIFSISRYRTPAFPLKAI